MPGCQAAICRGRILRPDRQSRRGAGDSEAVADAPPVQGRTPGGGTPRRRMREKSRRASTTGSAAAITGRGRRRGASASSALRVAARVAHTARSAGALDNRLRESVVRSLHNGKVIAGRAASDVVAVLRSLRVRIFPVTVRPGCPDGLGRCDMSNQATIGTEPLRCTQGRNKSVRGGSALLSSRSPVSWSSPAPPSRPLSTTMKR